MSPLLPQKDAFKLNSGYSIFSVVTGFLALLPVEIMLKVIEDVEEAPSLHNLSVTCSMSSVRAFNELG